MTVILLKWVLIANQYIPNAVTCQFELFTSMTKRSDFIT